MSVSLLIDAGNSRIKWALLVGGSWQTGAITAVGSGLDALTDALASLQRPDSVIVSNVRGEAFAQNLKQWIHAHWQRKVAFARSESVWSRLKNGYSDPGALGVDRWMGLIGAACRFRPPFCVVDLGTAITADWVDASGRHRGGVIAPGIQAMIRTLTTSTQGIETSNIKTVRPDLTLPFGCDTSDAILLGVHLSAAGLIEKAASRAQKGVGEGFILILTGGDAVRVSPYLELPHERDEWLVFRGLEALLLKRGFSTD